MDFAIGIYDPLAAYLHPSRFRLGDGDRGPEHCRREGGRFRQVPEGLQHELLVKETDVPQFPQRRVYNDELRAQELIAAYNREGGAMVKRENTHKQAEANKAFAHFAW